MSVEVLENNIPVGKLGPQKGRLDLPKSPKGPFGVVIYGGDLDPDIVISAGSEEGKGYVRDRFTELKHVIYLEAGVPVGYLPMKGKQVLLGYRIEVIKI